MAIIDEIKQQEISALIASVEKSTDAEFVAVLAKQSDKYTYIPLLWAAAVSMMTPMAMLKSPLWFDALDILIAQWIVFIVFALLFRIPAISIRLIPKAVRHWRASNMARRQFLENNLHHTKSETGVLLFVSEAERYVEIIADRGINNMVDQEVWQAIVDELVAAVKAGRIHEGLTNCINRCGVLLAEKVPVTGEKNELPDHLVLLY